jgi:hypothetical protein
MEDFTNALRGGYRKRAIFSQYNIILLFGAAAFSLASASWIPLLAAAVLEVMWVISAPWFSSFRHSVDSPIETPLPVMDEPPVLSVGAPADGPYRARRVRLTASLREIRALADEALGNGRNDELVAALPVLSDLADSFDRLCSLHLRLSRFVGQTSKDDIEQEVARLTEGFAKERDLGLRVTLRQALQLGQRRLEQYNRIVALYRASELRLDMIESAAAHVRSRGVTMASPAEFAGEIRGLVTHITTVSALEQDSVESPQSKRGASMAPATPVVAGDA